MTAEIIKSYLCFARFSEKWWRHFCTWFSLRVAEFLNEVMFLRVYFVPLFYDKYQDMIILVPVTYFAGSKWVLVSERSRRQRALSCANRIVLCMQGAEFFLHFVYFEIGYFKHLRNFPFTSHWFFPSCTYID